MLRTGCSNIDTFRTKYCLLSIDPSQLLATHPLPQFPIFSKTGKISPYYTQYYSVPKSICSSIRSVDSLTNYLGGVMLVKYLSIVEFCEYLTRVD